MQMHQTVTQMLVVVAVVVVLVHPLKLSLFVIYLLNRQSNSNNDLAGEEEVEEEVKVVQ